MERDVLKVRGPLGKTAHRVMLELRRPPPAPLRHLALEVGAVRMGPGEKLVVVHWDFAGPNLPEWELAYVLNQWAMRATANRGTPAALVSGYRERAGTIPPLDPSSFWLTITGFLNWTISRFNRNLETADPEDQTFDSNALRSLIADPLTVTKIEQLLDNPSITP